MSRILRSRRLLVLTACTLLALPCLSAFAQNYPSQAIRFVVAFPAGSGTDQVARQVATQISKTIGQPVVVENRAGASGFIAAQEVARARPDGYTILVTTGSTHAANPALFKKLPYDPVKDFTPISTIASTALVLVTVPGFPASTPDELAAIARSNPGKISFASANAPSRIGGEMFKMMANVDLLHVSYRGAPQALTDLIGGHVSVMWTDLITGIPLIESGKLKALAVTSKDRIRSLPNIPTMIESGFPDYSLFNWAGLYAPAKTPPDVVRRLNQLVHAAVSSNKSGYEKSGSEILLLTPEEFAELQASDTRMWSRVTRAAGMEPE